MPEFFADHAPRSGSEFFTGYAECAEWLWPEDEINRDKVKGWSRSALATMRADCAAFVKANRADLLTYCEESGRDMGSAGHDFFLSREGHGAGYFDRGNHPVFDKLQDAAQVWGDYGAPWLNKRGKVEL